MESAEKGGTGIVQLLQEEPTKEERYSHALEILAILSLLEREESECISNS